MAAPRNFLTTRELWKLMLVQSSLLVGAGMALAWWRNISVPFAWPTFSETLFALVLVAPLLVTSFLLLKLSPSYAKAMDLLQRLLGPPMRSVDVPLLAVLSSAVEEFFFRGVLQPMMGLLPAAILFGLVHIWNRNLWMHGLWAAVAGLYLGWIYNWSGNLCIPILIHAFNNLIGLAILRRS